MSAGPMICVGIPVWRAAGFVAETLESIRRQRDVRFVAFISIDGADTESEHACRPFLADPRFRMTVQETRLGWVANTAAVLAAALAHGVDYACVQPHDDLVDEDYLASLLAVAERTPSAAAVYCDIVSVGKKQDTLLQESVLGSPVERQRALLLRHFRAVAYRGLARSAMLARLRPISGNPVDDFGADTVWMARLATAGELVRVPRALYRKRYHPGNTHSRWKDWPREKKIAAWSRHCLDMLAEALTVARDEAARRDLLAAARARLLLRTGARIGTYQRDIAALGAAGRAALLRGFDAAALALIGETDGKETARHWAGSDRAANRAMRRL